MCVFSSITFSLSPLLPSMCFTWRGGGELSQSYSIYNNEYVQAPTYMYAMYTWCTSVCVSAMNAYPESACSVCVCLLWMLTLSLHAVCVCLLWCLPWVCFLSWADSRTWRDCERRTSHSHHPTHCDGYDLCPTNKRTGKVWLNQEVNVIVMAVQRCSI